MRTIFWIAVILIFWTYFGYPLLLKILSVFNGKIIKRESIDPAISLIITAYNEEKRIARKIENSLEMEYPEDKLEIIVVSDGSNDRTEEIVESYRDSGVKLLALPKRNGKHYGQGRGIEKARNSIVVLSDATTYLEKDALKKIVRNFADQDVGCVSGYDKVKAGGGIPEGEGAYVRYEMNLRSLESSVNSLVGVSGCFFAARKELCDDWIDNMSSDFYLPIIAYKRGFRTILEKEAIAYYDVSYDAHDEFIRKVRTVVHGMEVLWRFIDILNALKYGFFSIQMISHKLSRWLVPFYLLLALYCNIFILSKGDFYLFTFVFQIIFYGTALTAYYVEDLKDIAILKLPLFFITTNYSILVAWHNFLSGKDYVRWEPTRR